MSENSRGKRLLGLGTAVLLAALAVAGLLAAVRPVAAQSFTDCTAVTGNIDQGDCQALVDLYTSTGGPTAWITDTNWLDSNTPCAGGTPGWYGVSCSGTRVTSLILQNNGLSGTLPVSLGDLDELTFLGLAGNRLGGPIPGELGNLDQLGLLSLARNSLTGTIPITLQNLLNLTSLSLNGNLLEGLPPPELCVLVTKNGTLPPLSVFNLSHNLLQIDGADDCFAVLDPAWKSSQLLPPEILEVVTSVPGEITIRWKPISYTQDLYPNTSGGYEVFISTVPGVYPPGPVRRTTFISDTQVTVDEDQLGNPLVPGTDYFFRVRSSMTGNDTDNPNDRKSAFAPEFSAAPVALALLSFQAGASAPPWLLWGALLAGLLLVPPAVAWFVRRRLHGR